MILDTNGELFPEGRYTLRLSDVPSAEEVGQYLGWRFTFEADTEDGPRTYSERFMVWLMAPLMRALNYPEVKPGKFDFDPPKALGRSVVATIKHVTIEKGASAGKTVARMTEIQPAGATSKVVRAAVAAQAPRESEIPF
jgi:hypothetical protein